MTMNDPSSLLPAAAITVDLERCWNTPFTKQVWVVSGALLSNLVQGMIMSYPSILLPALRDPDSTITVDLDTASWISSSIGVSFIPSFFLSCFLMNYWGRRLTHIVTLIPGILGWLVIYFASSVSTLVIGRLLCGATSGGTSFLCAVIVAEYSGTEYRGVFLNLMTVLFSIGCMIVHISVFFVSWRTTALIALIPNVMALLITWTWPESPAWLASKGQVANCESAFFLMNERNDKNVRELEELIKTQNVQLSATDVKSSLRENIKNLLKKFKRNDFLKPLLIIFVAMLLLELSGRHIFPAYAIDIIDEIAEDKSMSFYGIIILDIVVTASTSFSSILVKWMNRRTLLFSTGLAAVIVLVVFCTYLFLVSKEIISNYSWISVSMLILFFIFVSLGCTTVPIGLLGEIIPFSHRGSGSAVGGVLVLLSTYGLLLTAPYLLASIKVRGTFAVLGAGMAACLLVLYFILPETKDRTLQEIDNYFTYGQYAVDRTCDEGKGEETKARQK